MTLLPWLCFLVGASLPLPVVVWGTWGVDPQHVWPWTWYIAGGIAVWLLD